MDYEEYTQDLEEKDQRLERCHGSRYLAEEDFEEEDGFEFILVD
jgi:hypothetical protein